MKDAFESLSNNEECLVDIIEELYNKEVANQDLRVEFNVALPGFVGKKPPIGVKDFLTRFIIFDTDVSLFLSVAANVLF